MTPDIRPGAIVHLYIPTIEPPNPKFGVIAFIDRERDSVPLFLIHSELPQFIRDSETLIKGVTKIDQQSHPFLAYDSWLRFGEPHARPYSEIMRRVGSGERCFCGYASNEIVQRLVELIPQCPELSARWQARYREALGSTLVVPQFET